MAKDTVIDFESYHVGTEIRDHYSKDGLGIAFMNSNLFDSGDYGYPLIERLNPGKAHSGNQVRVIKNCSGEFCKSLLVGKFNYTRHRVQVFVGETRGPSIST